MGFTSRILPPTLAWNIPWRRERERLYSVEISTLSVAGRPNVGIGGMEMDVLQVCRQHSSSRKGILNRVRPLR